MPTKCWAATGGHTDTDAVRVVGVLRVGGEADLNIVPQSFVQRSSLGGWTLELPLRQFSRRISER
jgi:hypothetical protein